MGLIEGKENEENRGDDDDDVWMITMLFDGFSIPLFSFWWGVVEG